LQLAATLFGEWVVVAEWGRIGSPGKVQEHVFPSSPARQTAEPERGGARRRSSAQIETLDRDLRGLCDRAILLIGFAGGLRRSEISGLDCGPDQTEDGVGWIEILDQGVLIRVRGKTGWREVVKIGRGSSDLSCPVRP
jgi:integrase